ncbi:MAG: hypothetical protein KF812_07180 [Fimbriimonadaceae bacterium]|nr:hypothetical protein [Fimbriimonadaceae bacterium]
MARKTVVWIWPGFLGSPEDRPWDRFESSVWRDAVTRSKVVGLRNPEPGGTDEAAYLGVEPRRIDLKEGPLVASAFAIEPPHRSVMMRVDIASIDENGRFQSIRPRPRPNELKEIENALLRLSTSRLIPVAGDEGVHVLVWEDGSLDLGLHVPTDAEGRAMRDNLPEGDGEVMLRRFIDDSVNLLRELPFNHERIEEGQTPINVLWPWGAGRYESTPDAARERGRPVSVATRDLRMRGVARQLGDFPVNAAGWYRGVHPDWKCWTIDHEAAVFESDAWTQMRRYGKFDEMAWAFERWQDDWLEPIWAEQETVVTVIAPAQEQDGTADGIALTFDPEWPRAEPMFPFDERSLDERRLTCENLVDVIHAQLRSPAID